MWHQRLREKGLTNGDRNTRYYHSKTINKRRNNKIVMLKNDHGNWIEEENELKLMVNEYYKKMSINHNRWCAWEEMIL